MGIFVPLAQLEVRKGHPRGNYNPLTKKDQADYETPVACMAVNSTCGLFVIGDAEQTQQVLASGEASLRKHYDFTRCPGAREVVEQFVQEWRGPPKKFLATSE